MYRLTGQTCLKNQDDALIGLIARGLFNKYSRLT